MELRSLAAVLASIALIAFSSVRVVEAGLLDAGGLNCLWPLVVDPSRSPVTLGAEVTQPLNAQMVLDPATNNLTFSGVMYLAFLNVTTGACPSSMNAFLATLFNTTAAFVNSDHMDTGLLLQPAVLHAQIVTMGLQPAQLIATVEVKHVKVVLSSLEPLKKSIGRSGELNDAGDLGNSLVALTDTGGSCTLESSLLGTGIIDLAGSTSTGSADVILEPSPTVDHLMTVQVRNLSANFVISPWTTPGIQFTTATLALTGSVTASLNLRNATTTTIMDILPPDIRAQLQVFRPNTTSPPPAPP